MGTAAAAIADTPGVSHNLLGQRLGRKGRDTRERIVRATETLLERSGDIPVSLSGVAREASLGMTTLYLYFADMAELLLAVLEPVSAAAEEAYAAHLRSYWHDDDLAAHCATFVGNYYRFWRKNARLLHLRNGLADARDERMLEHRIFTSHPLIALLARQMACPGDPHAISSRPFATVLFTGIERVVTVATDTRLNALPDNAGCLLAAQSHLLELGIRDRRRTLSGGGAA